MGTTRPGEMKTGRTDLFGVGLPDIESGRDPDDVLTTRDDLLLTFRTDRPKFLEIVRGLCRGPG